MLYILKHYHVIYNSINFHDNTMLIRLKKSENDYFSFTIEYNITKNTFSLKPGYFSTPKEDHKHSRMNKNDLFYMIYRGTVFDNYKTETVDEMINEYNRYNI